MADFASTTKALFDEILEEDARTEGLKAARKMQIAELKSAGLDKDAIMAMRGLNIKHEDIMKMAAHPSDDAAAGSGVSAQGTMTKKARGDDTGGDKRKKGMSEVDLMVDAAAFLEKNFGYKRERALEVAAKGLNKEREVRKARAKDKKGGSMIVMDEDVDFAMRCMLMVERNTRAERTRGFVRYMDAKIKAGVWKRSKIESLKKIKEIVQGDAMRQQLEGVMSSIPKKDFYTLSELPKRLEKMFLFSGSVLHPVFVRKTTPGDDDYDDYCPRTCAIITWTLCFCEEIIFTYFDETESLQSFMRLPDLIQEKDPFSMENKMGPKQMILTLVECAFEAVAYGLPKELSGVEE